MAVTGVAFRGLLSSNPGMRLTCGGAFLAGGKAWLFTGARIYGNDCDEEK